MSHPNQLVVIAAVLDTTQLTLYKEDGTTFPIPQGDGRIQRILDVCQAGLKKLGDKVTVDLTEENHYAAFEEKTGGLVKLFRVAKSKVKEFFSKTEVEAPKPITLGIVPSAKDVPAMTAVVAKRAQRDEQGEIITPLVSAVAEIMAHAVPVSNPDFREPVAKHEDGEPDTVIAVVGGQVIPDVAALKPQMSAAVLRPNATTMGMENFLSRLAKVMKKRRHSVEDLMKFMSKGDLPLADDGSIVIYKILKRKAGTKDTFVDCHSGNVPQKVGSYVCMDETMVDPDRRQDCSNGLHVASRSYLNNFGGDVVVLAKVAPEDVIAVPEYNINKMRVCGYHILALLSHDTFKTLKANKPMTDNSTDQAILGKVLAGDHIGIWERVEIGGPQGSNITITPVGMAARTVMVAATPRLAEALPDDGHVAPAIDVKAVAKQVTKERELIQAPPGGMNVTGPSLGEATPPPAPVSVDVVDSDGSVGVLTTGLPPVAPIAFDPHGPIPIPPPVEAVENPPYLPVVEQALAEAKPVKLSQKEEARVLYTQMLEAASLDNKQQYAVQLVNLKKSSKKSWDTLGFSDPLSRSILAIAAPALPQKGAIFTSEASIAKAEKAAVPKVKKAAPSRVVNDVETGLGTPKQRIRKLLAGGLTSVGTAQAIIQLKKAAKKSWTALAVTDWEVEQITKLAGE